MKQEWFESNDFVKITSKNKPDEQAQDVADKAEETIADPDTPIEKNTQVEEEVSQAEVKLENQQKEKIETPEDSEAKTDLQLLLSEEEKQRINLDLSTKHGSILHFLREGRRSFKNEENKDERLSNPYKTEKADAKDQLIARADQDIYLLKSEEHESSSRNR